MESSLEFLEPLTRLISTVVVIVLFFLFIVRPLLNYLFVNYQIEHRKKRNEEMMGADFASDLEESHHDEEGKKIQDGETSQGARASGKDAIGRLAASDPGKAGELVKKWLNSD